MSVELAETIIRIEPSAEMRAALKREIATFGTSVRGDYDVQWQDDRPNGGCLCITQKNLRGKVSVCVEIRAEDGSPRQVNLDDIQDFRRQLHRRLTNAKWVDEFYDAKDQERARLKEERKELAMDVVKEMIKLGKNVVTIDCGHVQEAPEIPESGYKVIDRRTKYEV